MIGGLISGLCAGLIGTGLIGTGYIAPKKLVQNNNNTIYSNYTVTRPDMFDESKKIYTYSVDVATFETLENQYRRDFYNNGALKKCIDNQLEHFIKNNSFNEQTLIIKANDIYTGKFTITSHTVPGTICVTMNCQNYQHRFH